jgi:hypothetical protein
MSDQPFDFIEAVARSRAASEAQHNAERWHAEKSRDAAAAERAYRRALAEAIVRLRSDGVAAVLAKDLARGDKHVSELCYQRDLAEGLRDAAGDSVWRHTADRKDLLAFIAWSQRASFLDEPESAQREPVIGGRRA